MTRAAQKQLRESKHHVTGTKEALAVASTLLRAYKGEHSAKVKEYTQLSTVQHLRERRTPLGKCLGTSIRDFFIATCVSSLLLFCKAPKKAFSKAISPPAKISCTAV